MNPPIETLDICEWIPALPAEASARYTAAIEDGQILYCPSVAFALSDAELRFLSPSILGDKAKSLAFDPASGILKHAGSDQREIAAMMRRFADAARNLVCATLPHYAAVLETGRTSFRPVGIEGRAASVAKDDTLMHVDAFPTSPVADRRILRVFSNVNRSGQSRHWRLGQPFSDVARRFYPQLRRPLPGSAWAMNAVGLTRGYRTEYDHTMLAIHDTMKRAKDYQRDVPQSEFHFPPGSTWIVFTDMVSHAALSGQHLFEQTFYLPVTAMLDQSKAPLRILERLAARALTPQHAG